MKVPVSRHTLLLFVCIAWLIGSPTLAAEQANSVNAPGKATVEIVSGPKSIASARQGAEKYWNALKTSDEKTFREVTAQKYMSVVFDWSYVNQTEITVEKGAIVPIKDELAACIDLKAEFNSLPVTPSIEMDKKLQIAKNIKSHADRIVERSPMLGDFLKKFYWEIITPKTILEAKNYQLMHNDFIVNAEFQSKGGATLKKRVTIKLRRMVADSYDSGWKVFSVEGM